MSKEETLVDAETGTISWDAIIKLYNDEHLDKENKRVKCKKCGTLFFSKNYNGEYPLCFKHRTSYVEKK